MRTLLRNTLLAAAVLAKASILLAVASFSQFSIAQQEFSCIGMPYMDVGERRLRALDQSVNRRLESPRYMLNPYPPEDEPDAILPDPDPVGAINELNDVRIDRLQSHERAEVFNLFAYAHYLNDNLPQALNFYKQTIAEEGANGPLVERNLKTIAQLNMLGDDFREALKYYLNWACLRLQKPETFLASRDYADLANIYYRIDDLDQALFYIEKAIDMEEAAGAIGRENWYSMQRSFYYQKENVPAVITVLKKLIVYYPNVKYWRELGGMFSELEDTRSQLASYQLAYLQNGLDTEGQMKGLSYLMIAAGAPYEGANLMIEGINNGLVEENEDVMRAIGSAFYQAREMDLALPWMERAAEEGADGENYVGLTGIYSSLLRYEDAIRVGNEALRLGDLGRPDQIKMAIGAAHAALREYDEAIESFRAITDSRSTRAADDWIRYATSEKDRDAQIRASGIDIDNL
jgi:tetratricopeptide (TPR) repeat protein|tara:strand:+ start:130073 stop:131458 length:1386 start_codon:yes stop_codon:yes gene_type:complete